MMRNRLITLSLAGSFVVSWLAGGPIETAGGTALAFQPTFTTVPCPPDVTRGIENEMSCGYLKVLEDRANPAGRTIRVFIVRIEPPNGEPAPDPMFCPDCDTDMVQVPNYGGAAGIAERTHRELIIMDPRGVGHSKPALGCPEVASTAGASTWGGAGLRRAFLAATQACHDRLTAKGIDVAAFNLQEIAADAEDLRMAFGIDQWNLITHGTPSSISFEMMRRYPQHIRAVVFDSPEAPQADAFTEAVAATRYAVGQVAEACGADAWCDRHFPDLRGAMNKALRRLDSRPSRSTIEKVPVVIDDATAVRIVRNMFIWNAAGLPRDIYSIRDYGFSGDLEPGAELDACCDPLFYPGYMIYYQLGSIGTFYSILCHDEVPFVDRTALAKAAGARPWYVDAYVHSPYFKACQEWDSGPATGADPHDPVVSDIPTLILHGRFDPFSPLPLIEEAAKTLSRGWVVEFPTLSHNVLASDCGQQIRNAWIVNPTSAPDTSCIPNMQPVAWARPVHPPT